MLWKASILKGLSICARDGEVGSVSDILFEDNTWCVRWLAVNTGPLLMGRKVLLPASCTRPPETGTSSITVGLTKKQVEDSPGIGIDLPVSRQMEMSLYASYGTAPYWTSPGMTGLAATAYPVLPDGPTPGARQVPASGVTPVAFHDDPVATERREERGDPHLRSANEVTGYYIHARDGDIGHVEDILIDSARWSVQEFIIDTKNWWPGKQVLIQPRWIEAISWEQRLVHLSRTRHDVKSAPEYDLPD